MRNILGRGLLFVSLVTTGSLIRLLLTCLNGLSQFSVQRTQSYFRVDSLEYVVNFLTYIFRKYALKAVVNIEKNSDALRGNRYLFELVFRERARNDIVRISDFVYKFHNSSNFCKPSGITWEKKVTVNVVLTVKNQGTWAQYFINEMSRIFDETGDDHVNIIVVDYGSRDIDIEEAFKR